MHDGKLKLLQEEDPAAEFAGRGFLAKEEPLQRAVIDNKFKRSAKDVAAKLVDTVDDSQAFEFRDRVVTFS